MADEKAGRAAIEAAQMVALDEIELALLTDAEKRAEPAKATPSGPEPQAGSYERFMMAFGGKLNGSQGGEDEKSATPFPPRR